MHVDNKFQWNTLVKHPEGILVLAGVTCPIYKNAVRGEIATIHNDPSCTQSSKRKKEEVRARVTVHQEIHTTTSVFLAKEKPIFSIMSA